MPKFGYFAANRGGYAAADRGGRRLRFRRGWKPKEVSEFCRELALLLRSGISLVQALTLFGELDGYGRRERRTCRAVLELVCQGVSFSDALERQGKAFPPMVIFSFRAAEEAGHLEQTAEQLADYYMKEHRTREKLAGALAYPKLLAVLIAAVLAVVAGYVLPQFEFLFSLMEELPLPTRILYGGLGFFEKYWRETVIGGVVLALAGQRACTVPAVRVLIDRMMLHLPYMGRICRTVCTAEFARGLSLLYRAGIPLAAALRIAAQTAGNSYISRQMEAAEVRVRAGENLGEVLGSIDGFSARLSAVIRIGGESRSLDVLLESMAEAMEYDAQAAVARSMTYLEPMMIVVMAVVVGFLMAAVMLPIYESYSAIELLAF